MAVQDVRERHAVSWGIPFTVGILLIIGGLFALYASVFTSIVTVLYLGTLLIIVGILEIVGAFSRRARGYGGAYFLAGILSVVVGALCWYKPAVTVASLTLLIAAYLFASGLFRGITALVDRYPRWGWDFAYGVLAVALGVYIVANWPIASFAILGMLVAIEIIARGITLMAASWKLREIEHVGLPGGMAAAAP